MPLGAYNVELKKNVFVNEEDFSHLNLKGKKYPFECRYCKKKMVYVSPHIRAGFDVKAFFRHHTKSDCEFKGETQAHLLAKQELYDAILRDNQVISAEIEKILEFEGERRIADVYFELENGKKYAIEVVKTSMRDFFDKDWFFDMCGIDAFWVFLSDHKGFSETDLLNYYILKQRCELKFIGNKARVLELYKKLLFYSFSTGSLYSMHLEGWGNYFKLNNFRVYNDFKVNERQLGDDYIDLQQHQKNLDTIEHLGSGVSYNGIEYRKRINSITFDLNEQYGIEIHKIDSYKRYVSIVKDNKRIETHRLYSAKALVEEESKQYPFTESLYSEFLKKSFLKLVTVACLLRVLFRIEDEEEGKRIEKEFRRERSPEVKKQFEEMRQKELERQRYPNKYVKCDICGWRWHKQKYICCYECYNLVYGWPTKRR